MFLPCPYPHILSSSLFFGSDSEMSHQPPAVPWPPVSVGTLQLRDGPERGLAGLPPSRSNPDRTPAPSSLSPAHAPCPLPGSPSFSMKPLWPPRSCILDMPSPLRWVMGWPHLQGLTSPQAPLFLLKGTDCNLGAGTCLPPSLWLPKGPVLTEPQATDKGPGLGRPCSQRPGLPPSDPLSRICNA